MRLDFSSFCCLKDYKTDYIESLFLKCRKKEKREQI